MPFEPTPQVERKFKKFADAILVGCQVTLPAPPNAVNIDSPEGKLTHGCAIVAMVVGMQGSLLGPEFDAMLTAYMERYDSSITSDYEIKKLTREQIAARIADL